MNAVLLQPLPFREPDRLVMLWTELRSQDIPEQRSSYGNFQDWKEYNQAFEDLAVLDPVVLTLRGTDGAEPISGAWASANLFELLGVSPLIGRTFSAQEEQDGASVLVLSYRSWQSRFGASPDVVGEVLEIDGRSSRVLGVMPPDFYPDTEFWEPHTLTADWPQQRTQRGTGGWFVMGRLKPKITLEQAQADMSGLASRLEEDYPENAGLGVSLVPLHLQMTSRNVRVSLWLLFGAVTFVLLIACANIANLYLVRGRARRTEIAIRMAAGATRPRLVRQLLTESVFLSLVAGMIGFLLARWGITVLIRLAPPNTPRIEEAGMDTLTFLFAAGVSVLAGVLFGIIPALRTSQIHPNESLKESQRGSPAQGLSLNVRGLFIVAEFALALVLLTGAGLLVHSFVRLQTVDLGFDPERLLLMNIRLPAEQPDAEVVAFWDQVVERVEGLPGIQSAGLIEEITRHNTREVMITEEGPYAAVEQRFQFTQDSVSPGIFRTLGAPLVSGRSFSEQNGELSPPVAIVNETLARRLWPNEDAAGKRFRRGRFSITVVGVVKDLRRHRLGPDQQPMAQMFLPLRQSIGNSRNMVLVVRTTSDPLLLAPAVRKTVRSIDDGIPLSQVTTAESIIGQSQSLRRFQTLLLISFASFALLLAAIGVYGLIHYSVAQRSHEIGIRMAVGANRGDVLRLVLRQGWNVILLGEAVGLAAALGTSQLMSSLLFQVKPIDPISLLAVILLLTAVGIGAVYIPAHRAARVDPMSALRYE